MMLALLIVVVMFTCFQTVRLDTVSGYVSSRNVIILTCHGW